MRSVNPFPGLRPFQTEEQYIFFGREDQTAELLELLREHRFLAVVGSSGSGKSSLVRAGLIPALHRGTMMRAGSDWEVILLRPGGDPISNLARALIAGELYDSEDPDVRDSLRATLTRSLFGLVEAIRQSGELEPETNLLVVVDQFEEIFRFRQRDVDSEESAGAFVRLLLTAAQDETVNIYIAITMRSDYLGDCANIPGLAEAVNRGEYLIPRLTRDQKRDAIEKPVGVGGASIAPRLVQKMLNDVGDDPDQLPVLQHALMRTWEHWTADPAGRDQNQPIDLDHYEAIGSMSEALSLHADEVFASLPDDEHRNTAKRVFKALTEKGADNRGIRRPTRLERLERIVGADRGVVTTVINAFRRPGVTFLMPGEDRELQDRTVIDLSHESLMRVWRSLRVWVEEEAQSARVYRRLADTAALWKDGHAGLFHDPDLGIAQAWHDRENPNEVWAEQYGGGFDVAEEFLRTSREAAERVEQEKEAARRRELAQAQALAASQARAARLFKRFAVVVAAGFLVAVGLSIWAFHLRNEASLARAKAQFQEGRFWHGNALSLADSKHHFAAKLMAARAIGFEGFGRSKQEKAFQDTNPVAIPDGSTERERIVRFLREEPDYRPIWRSDWGAPGEGHTEGVDGLAFSPDGRLLASGSYDHTIKLWDLATGRLAATLEGHTEGVREVSFSPDGRLLASAGFDDVRIWDVERCEAVGNPIRQQVPLTCDFSPDGSLVVVGGRGAAVVWEVATRSEVRRLSMQGWVVEACFGPGSNQITTFRGSRGVRVWTTDATEPAWTDLPAGPIAAPPDGDRLFIGRQGEVVAHHSRSGEHLGSFAGTTEWIRAVSVSPDGQLLAGASGDRILLWSVRSSELITQMDGGAQIRGVAFGPDGRILASSDAKGAIALWDLAPGKESSIWHERGPLQALVVSPDGRTLASASGYPIQGRMDEVTHITLRDLRTGGVRLRLQGHDRVVSDLAYSPDGRLLASISMDWTVRLWDPETGTPLRVVDRHSRNGDAVAFSRDGRLLAASYPGTIKVWDTESWEQSSTFALPGANVFGLVFDPVTEVLYSGSRNGVVRRLDARAGEKLADYTGHTRRVNYLDVATGGRWLITASDDNQAHLLDTTTLEVVRSFSQGDDVNVAVISSDGGRVATGGDDEAIRLWDIETGAELVTLRGHLDDVWCLAFADDGKTLISGAEDGTIRTWNIDDALDVGRDYASYVARGFELETHRISWFSPEGDAPYQVTADFFDLPYSSYLNDLRSGRPPAQVHRALFWRYLAAENWPSALHVLKTLEAGEEETPGATFRRELVWRARRAIAAGNNDLAERRLRLAAATEAEAGTEAATEVSGLRAILLMRQGKRSEAEAELARSVPENTTLIQHRELLALYLDALLRDAASLTLGQLKTAAILNHYVRRRDPYKPHVEVPRPAVEEILKRLPEVERRLSLVPFSTRWRYLDDGSEPLSGWTSTGFGDEDWDEGVGKFGFGDDDVQTPLKQHKPAEETDEQDLSEAGLEDMPGQSTTSTRSREDLVVMAYYFRHQFDVPDGSDRAHLVARLRRDDGIAVYLNGEEVIRDNLPEGQLSYDSRAISNITSNVELLYLEYALNPSLLRPGTNIIAAEVHQDLPSSSDVGFHLELYAADLVPATYLTTLSSAELSEAASRLEQILPPPLAERWSEEVKFAYTDSSTISLETASPRLCLARARVLDSLGRRSEALRAAEAGLRRMESDGNRPDGLLVSNQLEYLLANLRAAQ